MKLLFIIPNFKWNNYNDNTLWQFVPYGVGILMSILRDICEVSIVDANMEDMSEEEFVKQLKKENPDIVGISVLTDLYADGGHKTAELIKNFNNDIIVTMGGVYATTNPEEIIKDKNIDYVFIGEGEVVLKEFVLHQLKKGEFPSNGICYREGERVINLGRANLIYDLDSIPMPAYDLIDYNKYYTNVLRNSVDRPSALPYAGIITSRGCPWNCIFCQVDSIAGKKFRARSAKNILNEIQYLKETYGVKSIIFYDDNLFTDKKRAKDIFQGMIDRKINLPWKSIATAVFRLDEELIDLMVKSGCEYIDIAIESGTERIRDFIGKPIDFEKTKEIVKYTRKAGIYVAANFVIGFPGET